MGMRSCLLPCVLCLGLGFGCKDDSGDDFGRRDGGASMGNPDAGGGPSGGAPVTAEQAAAGACPMGGGDGMPECEGVAEYTTCVLDTCALRDCLDEACSDLLGCLEDADDPCAASCTASTECMECQMAQSQCILNSCFDLIMCGTIEEGGACDQLTECCEGFAADDPMKFGCDAAATFSRSGGDASCMTALESYCP